MTQADDDYYFNEYLENKQHDEEEALWEANQEAENAANSRDPDGCWGDD